MFIRAEHDIARAAQKMGAVKELFRKTAETLANNHEKGLLAVLGVSQEVGSNLNLSIPRSQRDADN